MSTAVTQKLTRFGCRAASPRLKLLFEIQRSRNPTCLVGDFGHGREENQGRKRALKADYLDKKAEGRPEAETAEKKPPQSVRRTS